MSKRHVTVQYSETFCAEYFEQPDLMSSNNTAVPGLNLAFLDAVLKLGLVVHNSPYYNLGSGSKLATPAYPQGGKCAPKIRFLTLSRQNDRFGKNVSNNSFSH